MNSQRLYLVCTLAVADALEAAVQTHLGPGFLALERRSYNGVAVASFWCTDAQAIKILLAAEGRPNVFVVRGPDDDGPRVGDVLVDLGDPLPTLPAVRRYTWRRIVADRGLTPAPKGVP